MSQLDCYAATETDEPGALLAIDTEESLGRQAFMPGASEFLRDFAHSFQHDQKHLPGLALVDSTSAMEKAGSSPARARDSAESSSQNADKEGQGSSTVEREAIAIEQENSDSKVKAGDSLLVASDIQSLVDKNFGRLDLDGDGFISPKELDAATVNKDFQGDDARLIAVLKEHRHDLEELSNDEWGPENDGVTRADIAKFSELLSKAKPSKSEEHLIDDINRILRDSQASIGNASRELFANKDNPIASINPEAIKQGEIGDCYFLGALAALASSPQGKESIKNMIKDNGNGTYTVTFPGAKDKPVTVEAPTDAELARYAQGSADGTWPAVLEKAYGKYCNAKNIDPHEGIPDGGSEEMGLEILTGRSVDTDYLTLTRKETTHRKLAEAMKDGRPVTAGIYGEIGEGFGLSDGKTDDAGIPSGHLYTIEAYDPATRTLTIRNPWGKGEPTAVLGMAKDGENDGVFKMSLDEFYKNFSSVSYAEK